MVALAMLPLVSCAPSCGEASRRRSDDETPPPPTERETLDPGSTRAARPVVYVISNDGRLFTFDPRNPGREAYGLVGELDCADAGNPRSMAIDRNGSAWVFLDTGALVRVDLADASCRSTDYRHPSSDRNIGMGFTADAPGASSEKLYVISPDFGLATIGFPDLRVTASRKLAMHAELTGGGDGKLFLFAAETGELLEVDRQTHRTSRVHIFFEIRGAHAWAFARYGGKFYVFTAPWTANSRTTELDPKTHVALVRDPDVGFVIVGAGQSTLTPLTDGRPGVHGEFDDPDGGPN